MKTMPSKSITVLLSAYNEEKNIEKAVRLTEGAVKSVFKDYELIILQDGSTDRTAEVAENIARRNKRVKVIHNKVNMNTGYSFRRGVAAATKKYITILPGSGGIEPESIRSFLQHTDEADIVMSYVVNKGVRPWNRQLISGLFTGTINALFGLSVKYYLGMVVYETELVRKVKQTTNSYAFLAEIIVKLLKRGCTYKEIPMELKPKAGSKMFRIKNITGVMAFLPRLYITVQLESLKRLLTVKKDKLN